MSPLFLEITGFAVFTKLVTTADKDNTILAANWSTLCIIAQMRSIQQNILGCMLWFLSFF
jgi:hypothetical protein